MKKNALISTIIVLAILIFAYYVLTKNSDPPEIEIAKCIGEKSTLYTKVGCFACDKQEELFGKNYQYLNVVQATDWDTLSTFGIKSTPTWVIDNVKYSGVQSLKKLKDLTGC